MPTEATALQANDYGAQAYAASLGALAERKRRLFIMNLAPEASMDDEGSDMTLTEDAFYLVFGLMAFSLIALGLTQRFRGSPSTGADDERALEDDRAEGMLAICSGVAIGLLTAAAYFFMG